MSKPSNRTRSSQPNRQTGLAGVNPPARPGLSLSDSTGSSAKTDIPTLSHRQQSALPLVALAPSIAQAARATGVGKTTLRRWLDDPDFRAEVTRLRQETADLARKELQGLMLRGVSVINDALDDPNPAIRLRAARYALSFGDKATDIHRLAADLKDLKDGLATGPQTRS